MTPAYPLTEDPASVPSVKLRRTDRLEMFPDSDGWYQGTAYLYEGKCPHCGTRIAIDTTNRLDQGDGFDCDDCGGWWNARL